MRRENNNPKVLEQHFVDLVGEWGADAAQKALDKAIVAVRGGTPAKVTKASFPGLFHGARIQRGDTVYGIMVYPGEGEDGGSIGDFWRNGDLLARTVFACGLWRAKEMTFAMAKKFDHMVRRRHDRKANKRALRTKEDA